MKVLVIFFLIGLCSMQSASQTVDCHKDGLIYADPSDCSQYFVCESQRPILMKCPAGLWFSVKVSACDWPYNIQEGSCTPPKHLQ